VCPRTRVSVRGVSRDFFRRARRRIFAFALSRPGHAYSSLFRTCFVPSLSRQPLGITGICKTFSFFSRPFISRASHLNLAVLQRSVDSWRLIYTSRPGHPGVHLPHALRHGASRGVPERSPAVIRKLPASDTQTRCRRPSADTAVTAVCPPAPPSTPQVDRHFPALPICGDPSRSET
jgi:hypothetical protein